MNDTVRPSFWSRCHDDTERDRRNMFRWLGLVLLWAICFVGASWLLKRELVSPGPAAWAVAILPTIAGIVAVLAYVHYLRAADELQRQIQLNGLALGFGVTWLAIAGYPLLERAGAPVADVNDYSLVMAASFSLGILLAWRRYR